MDGSELVTCGKCRTLYHPECWEANNRRCGLYACAPTPSNKQLPPSNRSSKLFALVAGTLAALLLVVLFLGTALAPSEPPGPEVPRIPFDDVAVRVAMPVEFSRENCKNAELIGENATWVEKGHGFSVRLPEGWRFGPGGVLNLFRVTKTDASDRKIELSVSAHQAHDYKLGDFFPLSQRESQSKLTKIGAILPGYWVRDSGRTTIAAGDALWSLSTNNNAARLIQKDYFLMRGSRLFNISCITWSDMDFLKEHEAAFDAFAKSFKFTDGDK